MMQEVVVFILVLFATLALVFRFVPLSQISRLQGKRFLFFSNKIRGPSCSSCSQCSSSCYRNPSEKQDPEK